MAKPANGTPLKRTGIAYYLTEAFLLAEASGATITGSKAGITGTLAGAYSWVDTDYGKAVQTASGTGYGQLTDAAALRFTGAFSLFWAGIFAGVGGSSSGLVSKLGGAAARACGLQWDQNGRWYQWMASNATTLSSQNSDIYSYNAVDVIVAVWEPSTRLTIYANGAKLKETTTGIYSAFFNANGLGWALMSRGDLAAKTNGKTLAFGFFGKALSDAEVAQQLSTIDQVYRLWGPSRRAGLGGGMASLSGGFA